MNSRTLQLGATFFVRSYWPELLSVFSGILSALISYSFFQKPHTVFAWTIAVLMVSFFFILIHRRTERQFHYISLTKRDHRDKWIGRGNFNYDRQEHCHYISNAEDGFLLPKCFGWANYKYEFEFKINTECLGVVVRALSFSDLLMLQIHADQDRLRAHFRVNGAWVVFDETSSLGGKIKLHTWYLATVVCDRDKVELKITSLSKEKKPLYEAFINVPHGIQTVRFLNKDQDDSTVQTKVIPLDVNYDFGTVGFRNFGKERALVRNVIIEKID